MKKDFDARNARKKATHERGGRYYHERGIWWCSLGVNVGFEQDGGGRLFQRPVLVLKALNKHTCVVVPLTTSSGDHHPMRIPLGLVNGKSAFAIVSQLRVLDTRRFTERLAILNPAAFVDVQKAAKTLF